LPTAIAIGDVAQNAEESDVSTDDARLYLAHVQELIGSLPRPL
jgi:hypothetical protein